MIKRTYNEEQTLNELMFLLGEDTLLHEIVYSLDSSIVKDLFSHIIRYNDLESDFEDLDGTSFYGIYD